MTSRATWVAALATFALVLLCHTWQLAAVPLSRTEGHRALPGHLMRETGDWIVPRFYDEVYLRKPPFHYWVIAASETVLGRSDEWAWRLPSALAAALLGAFLVTMSARWFGPRAGWVAGPAFLSLGALWNQSRSADIDAVNTLTGLVATLAFLELGFGRPQGRRWAWSLLAGAAFGVTLLAKGPGALPLILGALLGASLATRQWRWLYRPGCVAAVLLGVLIPAAWAWALREALRRQGVSLDATGIQEAGANVFDLRRLGGATGMVAELWAYSLPVSFLIVFCPRLWRRDTWQPGPGPQPEAAAADLAHARFRAVLGTALAAVLVYWVNGIDNVRYVYPVMPLWCLVAGAVAEAVANGWFQDTWRQRLERSAAGLALALGVAVPVAGGVALARGAVMPVSLVVAGLAAPVCGWFAARALRAADWRRGLAWLSAVLALLTVPVTDINQQTRRKGSAEPAARLLADTVPAGTELVTGSFVRDKPELYLYAGRPVQALGTGLLTADPAALRGRWIVFSGPEWEAWRAKSGIRFGQVVPLPVYRTHAILARADAEEPPPSSQAR